MNKYAHLDEMECIENFQEEKIFNLTKIDVVMDATNIQYDDYCFDFIFDKGTFDCILGSTNDPVGKAQAMIEVNKIFPMTRFKRY